MADLDEFNVPGEAPGGFNPGMRAGGDMDPMLNTYG